MEKEIVQKIRILKNKDIAIVIKYPSWMKFLLRFIKIYIIPDTKKFEMNFFGLPIPIETPKSIIKIGDIV